MKPKFLGVIYNASIFLFIESSLRVYCWFAVVSTKANLSCSNKQAPLGQGTASVSSIFKNKVNGLPRENQYVLTKFDRPG